MSLKSRATYAGVAVAAVLSLSLTGCAQASHAGAAAIVGDIRISTVELEAVVNRGLADPMAAQQLGADRPTFERQVLSRLIQSALVEKLAKDNGVTVTDQEVAAKRASYAQQAGGDSQLVTQAAQNGVAAQDLEDYIRTIVLRDAVGAKLTEKDQVPDDQLRALYEQNIAQYDTVHAAHILIGVVPTGPVGSDGSKTPTDADYAKILPLATQVYNEAIADPSKFADLAKQYSTDTSNKDQGGDLGYAGKGQFVKPFEDAIFNGKPGTIVGPVKTQFGYHIIKIIDHKKVSFEQAKADLKAQALSTQISDALSQALTAEAAKDHVSVNPRFGSWDNTQSQVVAPTGGLSSPAANPSASPDSSGDTSGLLPSDTTQPAPAVSP